MDNKSVGSMGGDIGKIVSFPGVDATNEKIEQSGAVFGGEEDEREAFYGDGERGSKVISLGAENGQNLENVGPAYGEPMVTNRGDGLSFDNEVKEAMDLNRDGIISVTEELEYIDDQEMEISKNLTRLPGNQVKIVKKKIDGLVNSGDAYGAVENLQRLRTGTLEKAFGRNIGGGNVA